MGTRIEDDFEQEPPLDPEHRTLWLLGLGPISREKVIRASRETQYSVSDLAFFISCCPGEKELADLCCIEPVRPQLRSQPHCRRSIPPKVLR